MRTCRQAGGNFPGGSCAVLTWSWQARGHMQQAAAMQVVSGIDAVDVPHRNSIVRALLWCCPQAVA
jgi:hypothetical protein